MAPGASLSKASSIPEAFRDRECSTYYRGIDHRGVNRSLKPRAQTSVCPGSKPLIEPRQEE